MDGIRTEKARQRSREETESQIAQTDGSAEKAKVVNDRRTDKVERSHKRGRSPN